MRGERLPARGRTAAAIWFALTACAAEGRELSVSGSYRVLHFGDSHVAAGSGSSPLRILLGGDLPDGGPGLLTFGSLPADGSVSGVRVRLSAGFRRSRWRKGAPSGAAGLDGGWAEAAARGERVSFTGSFTSVLLVALRQPGGGTLSVSLDGRPSDMAFLGGGGPELAVLEARASDGPGIHSFQAETRDAGRVRLLGILLTTGAPGLVYSPVGVVGASAALLTASDEGLFARQVALLSPTLVLVSFGTNEAREKGFEPEAYRELFAAGLARIRTAAPGVPLLVIGPPHQERRGEGGAWEQVPRQAVISRRQGEVCARDGVPYLDLAEAMADGDGIRSWFEGPRPFYQPDRVHFTRAGYERLARIVAVRILGEQTVAERVARQQGGPAGSSRGTSSAPALTGGPYVRAFRQGGRLVLTNVPGEASARPVLGRNAER